eukprot:504560-Amphidinium_carterae.1
MQGEVESDDRADPGQYDPCHELEFAGGASLEWPCLIVAVFSIRDASRFPCLNGQWNSGSKQPHFSVMNVQVFHGCLVDSYVQLAKSCVPTHAGKWRLSRANLWVDVISVTSSQAGPEVYALFVDRGG